MDISELRKGNFVKTEHGILPVSAIVWNNVMVNGKEGRKLWANNVDPVELTDEWLIEFGFEFKNGYWYKFKFGYISKSDMYWMYHGIVKQIQYVHQLQNLYFELTNNKLTIK